MSEKNKPYEIRRTIKSDDIPSWSNKGLYDPIIKSMATLEVGEALEVKVESMKKISAIRKKATTSFEHTEYKVYQRQRENGKFCYIERIK